VKEDPSDSELREKLAAWRVESRLPDDFQQRVWKRIAVREAANSGLSWPTGLERLSIFGQGFPLPRLALAAIGIGLLIRTTTGVVEASRWNSVTWNRLEAKYVQSIDPYQRIPGS